MFKLESYISPLLMGYLDKYVKLRQEDFQLSLWGGDAILNNLDLRLDELEKIIQLPVMFQSGHIHELRLHVPWTKLGSEPVVITINTVECILKVRDTAYEGGSTSNSSEVPARTSNQRARKRNPETEALPPGYLQSIINRIVNNVTFVINNLILKFVEDDIVLSVNIKSAECYSVDRDWNRAFVDLTQEDLALRKVLNFADLTVCLDKTNASGHIESYQEPMAYRCAVTCRLHMHYESITSKYPKATRFNMYCDVLNLTLTDTQLPMFVRLIELFIAMYYGSLDIPMANEGPSDRTDTASTSMNAVEISMRDDQDDSPDDQGWASWAWSYVPQILPNEGEDEAMTEDGTRRNKRVRHAPLILSLGFYFHQGNIVFKLTERAKESSELPHKKMHFHPFLTLAFEGMSLEVLLQGLTFCNVQSGISAVRLFTCGDCICGIADENFARCNTLLTGGEPLSQKVSVSYLSNSLFDAMSFENQGHPAQYILDKEQHHQAYTEQYGLQKFGAFWEDYLYTFEKPKKRSGAGSQSSDTDGQSTAIFDKEFSTLRFLLGNTHLVLSSSSYHRMSKFLHCMWDHQYEPYGSTRARVPSEDRPKPTEEQIMSLEEFIPTQLIHLALINPSAVMITSEHEECDVKKKRYKSKHRKRKSKQVEAPQNDLACLAVGASRFDLQVTKPMYPGRLVKLVSAIAGPSSNLLHHCHNHTQIKLFSLQAGLQRTSIDGKMSRPLTLIPPCSFALYSRYLLLPKLWNNTSLPIKEWMYEIPSASINLTKASILMASRILSSWTTPKTKKTVDILDDSLLDDLFPPSGESTSQRYPLIELNLCGLEFKSCNSSLVDAYTGSLSALQVFLYTPGTGGRMVVVPILGSPAEVSRLTNSGFFSQDSAIHETVSADCITATLQKPKDTGIRQAQALALVDCQGFALWLDPVLMSWFHYCPQPRPVVGQPAVTLDMSLAQMTSPLNAMSQASVHSTSSPSHQGRSQAQTSSHTAKLAIDRKSQPTGDEREKKRERVAKERDADGSHKETTAETLARHFPLIQALHLQVDIKSSVIFLPKTGLPTHIESTSDIVGTVQQAYRDGHLASTLVICLPAILVTSTMSRPMNVLQELPITDFHESLIGEKLPWTIKLSNTCVYSLFPGHPDPFLFLLRPVDIVSTMAINCTYNPPTSDQISGLAFCIHTDVGTPHTSWTSSQLHLLSIVSVLASNLSEDFLKLYTECVRIFITKKAHKEASDSRDQSNLKVSFTSTTHKMDSVLSGEVTELLTTDISEDMSHDASPLHESLIDSDEENGVKLSIWLQVMVSKLECQMFHTCARTHKGSAVSCVLETFDLSLDSQSVYSKVKMTLGSFSMQHAWKGSDGSWCWTDPEGIIVSCARQLPRHIYTVSNKLWLAENSAGISFAQSHDTLNREKKHGLLSVTLTHALCKNVKRRMRKANVELPVVIEKEMESSTTGCDADYLYFHEYLTEICLKVGPMDVVVKAEAVDIIMGLLSGIGKKSQPVRKSPKPQQSPVFVSVRRPPETETPPLASFAVHNLPLLYADLGLLRIFVPLPHGKSRQQNPTGVSCDDSDPSLDQTASPLKPNVPSSSVHLSRNEGSSVAPIMSQPGADVMHGNNTPDSVSKTTLAQSQKLNVKKDVQSDVKAVASTLDHDMLVIQVNNFLLQPHAENPLPRTPCDKSIFHKAVQSGMSYQPGASVEDRQYQLDVRGLALSTGCWDQVLKETKKAELQKSPTGSMVQIPALEWNTFLMDSVGEERKDIKLVPLATAFDTCLVVAPPIFSLPRQDKEAMWKPTPHLICGLTTELNLTSDLDLYLSTSQLDLLNQLGIQLGERFTPSPPAVTATALATSHFSASKILEGSNSIQPLNPMAVDPSLLNTRGGDSGVESDISTLTLDHAHRPGVDRGQLGLNAKPTDDRMNLSSLGTPFTGSPRVDKAEAKTSEMPGLLSSKSSFDLLVTAGRISCTVYMHKILDENLTLEMPLFQERKAHQRLRHQSSLSPKSSGMPVKDNLDQQLKSTPRRRYRITQEYTQTGGGQNEGSSDSNEEEFTEFNFMKQTPEENLKKTIPEGSACILPLVYLYLTQPHCILSNHGGSQMKAELACYDALIKGASDQHLAAIDDYHIIPDCADFNVHWLETRAGQPHPYTGIPPSLLTIQFLREPNKPDTVGFHLERPLRLKVSRLAVEQMAAFSEELQGLNLGQSSGTPQNKDPRENRQSPSNDKAVLDPLAFVDRISVSTSQVVVTLEMSESEANVGGTFSLESFKTDVDLQKTESEVTPLISSHVKDVVVKLTMDKKTRPLIGPVTLSVDACLSWIPLSADKFKPQLLLVVDCGVVLITFGQEHVFCLTQLVQTLTKLQQDLLQKLRLSSKKQQYQSKSCESSKAESGQRVMPDFIQDYSHDDLRSGGFKFVDETEGSESTPEPNEVVFSSCSSCSSNSNNNKRPGDSNLNEKRMSSSHMSWCYPHPRVLTSIQLTPVPFSLSSSTMSLDSTAMSSAKVACVLQYYDELVCEFVDLVEFFLSESESVNVNLPQAKPCNANQLVMAKMWRVVLLQSDDIMGDVAVLPASLAACMCIDSAFIPSLIPDVQVSLNLPLAKIHLCHHLEYNGRDIPAKLSQYQSVFDLVEEQEFALVRMSDVQLTGSHFSQFDRKTSLKASLSPRLDVMEYGHLLMMPVVSPVHVSLAADLVAKEQGHELDAHLQMGKLRVAIGKGVVHSLNMAMTAWTNFNVGGTGPQLIFNHYIICNNTMATIRIGQVGTEENITLQSRQMYAYSWRSFTSAQMLHLCINKPSWKWTEPFPIDTQGTWVRCVNARDQDYVVIIKVTNLTPVQKQVTISGQMLLSNQLSQDISLKVSSNHGTASSSTSPALVPPTALATPSSFDPSSNSSHSSSAIASYGQVHHYVIQAGATMPSLVASEIHNRPIQFRLAGFNTAWSHEIYLSGDSMKDNQMVKIPLPDDNAYFHIWCRIFCQHFQGVDQKLVMLTPLYVVRTHLPRPLFIHMETAKLKGSQELLTKSQGHEFQFHCKGGDITHNMSFRLGSNKQLSSPPVVLSTGLIGQLERKTVDPINVDSLCLQKRNVMRYDWPYLMEGSASWDLDGQEDSRGSHHHHHQQKCSSDTVSHTESDVDDNQPSIDLNVRLSEYIPGCDTLLVEVTPPCLVTNVTDLCLVLGEMSSDGQIIPGEHWTLKAGHTLSPPLPTNHFMLAVEHNGQISSWRHIPLSDEASDYKRYNEDLGKILFIDSHVQVSFSLVFSSTHSSEMIFLTVTSDFQHGIRTISIREQFCISNKFRDDLVVKLLALPLSSPKVCVCDAETTTVLLPSRKKSEKEVDPLPKWSLIDTSHDGAEAKSDDSKNREDSFVFYLSLATKDQHQNPKKVSQWYWSHPVRVNLTKGSHRMTTSLPRSSELSHHSSASSRDSQSKGGKDLNLSGLSSTENLAPTTQALCLSSYQKEGVTYMVIMEDTAPVIVVENLCPFALEFGQALTTGNSKETAVQEQLELVSDLPWVPPGGWSHYTMPTVNVEYSSKETLSIPRMLFRVKAGYTSSPDLVTKGSLEWSSAVQISGLDAFIRLQDVCDLTVKIEVIGMVTHLIIRPVSKAEITAKEIRSRLKTQETESVRSKHSLPASHVEHSVDGSKSSDNLAGSSNSENVPKSKAITESLTRYTDTKEGKEMLRSQTLFQATVGFYCSYITLIIQDESTTGEVSEIVSFFIEDLYAASFPLSRNPTFIGTENCYAVSVGYAQLDNQLYGNGSYDFPVIFLPQAVERQSGNNKSTFLSDVAGKMSVMETLAMSRSKAVFFAQIVTFSDRIWNQSAFESAECSVQAFSLYVEDGFVYRLIEELETFAPSKLVVSGLPSSQLELIQSKLPPAAIFNALMLSQPIRIKQLIIQPISMLLSVHASLKLFLASDQTPLNLAKFERMLVFSSTQRLLNAVTMHYASAAIFRAGIMVGSLEILGNPTGLVRSISTGVSDLVRLPYSGLTQGPVAFVGGVSKGVGSLVKNISAGMITSVTNFASSVSRNMDRLSLDATHKERQEQNRRNRPSGMSDGLIQGLTGFGLSLLGAVAGLADQPIRNLLATGDQRSSTATAAASGLVTGVGKGIVGMLTKPIGGAAELVSQTGQGILHGTGLGQMPTRVHSPSTLERSSLPSSCYKYCVKLFTTLPSPTILLALPAVTFDMLGREVKVILVLTSDVLVVVNVEEDCQQLTLSLSELECRSVDAQSDEAADDDEADRREEALRQGEGSSVDGERAMAEDDDADGVGSGNRLTASELDGYQAKISLVWTDHYYNNYTLEHNQSASKDRIAAFIDSTQNLAACLIPHDATQQNESYQPVPAVVGSSLPDQRQDTGSPPLGQDTPPFRRSVSDSSQTESSAPNLSVATRPTDSPQYDFNLNPRWRELFLTTFHTAKQRLQGQGFSV